MTIDVCLRLVALSAVIAAVSACGRTDSRGTSASDTRNVFSIDNREDISSTEYPWSAVGRLDSGCTGTLVGRQLVLTAAHCVYDSEKKAVKKTLTYFRPNMIKGESKSPTWIDYAWFGSETPEENRGGDWAILKLAKPIGDTYRWLPVRQVNVAEHLPFTTSLAGYSTDRNKGNTASVHRGCYVLEQVGDRLLHDCDAAAGVSGGPMITVYDSAPNIVGISVSEYRGGAADSVHAEAYKKELANVAIGTKDIYTALETIRKAVDAGQTPAAMAGVKERSNPNVPGAPDVTPDLPNPDGSGGDGGGNHDGTDDYDAAPPLPSLSNLVNNASAIETSALSLGRLVEVMHVNARDYWRNEELSRASRAMKEDVGDILSLAHALTLSSTSTYGADQAMQRFVRLMRMDHVGLKATWTRVASGVTDNSAKDLVEAIKAAHAKLNRDIYP